jgi:hypothetical protein
MRYTHLSSKSWRELIGVFCSRKVLRSDRLPETIP